MQPLEVHVEVALIVRQSIDDTELLPMLLVLDVPVVRHGPILLLVPILSIVPTINTLLSVCMYTHDYFNVYIETMLVSSHPCIFLFVVYSGGGYGCHLSNCLYTLIG